MKEMIQKIKLLQTEMAQSILNAEMGEQHLQQVRLRDDGTKLFHQNLLTNRI